MIERSCSSRGLLEEIAYKSSDVGRAVRTIGHAELRRERSAQRTLPGWVFVEDRTGTQRDEDVFTTDIGLTPKQIIAAYTGRWAIEVMFQEVREHLGDETTRGWCERTILRAEPCLFGLCSLVALRFSELPQAERQTPLVIWTGSLKPNLTFSDAVTIVRRNDWRIWILESPRRAPAIQKLTAQEQPAVLDAVTQAL